MVSRTRTRSSQPPARAKHTIVQTPKSKVLLPIDGHRAFASVALALMMLYTLLAPTTPISPDPDALITPQIDGAGAVLAGATSEELEQAIFPYSTIEERSQAGIGASWPDVYAVLSFEPDHLMTRRAIIGEIYASSSGNINERLKTGGLSTNPPMELVENIADVCASFLGGESNMVPRGYNCGAAMMLVRSLMEPDQRTRWETRALTEFTVALGEGPDTWQFQYNWALANFLAGNYAQAHDGMSRVVTRAEADEDPQSFNLLPRWWMGMSLLRLGKPGEAIVAFRDALNTRARPGGNEAYRDAYERLHDLAREGLGDAQWANRDPAAAYQTYFDALLYGNVTHGLYSKWRRLGLQQHGYDRLLSDMATLTGSPNFRDAPQQAARIRHDRARLLSFLGRHDEALAEHQRALELGENDAALLVSYAQALESRGDHEQAIFQAEEALRKLGRDPATADLTIVAATAVSTLTVSLEARENAQQVLDANLLRARAYGAQGNTGAVAALVQNITLQAASAPPDQAGLLHLYAAFAQEAGSVDARESYAQAWERLKSLPAGSPGRAAALSGLARSTTAAQGDPQAGLQLLRDNGYDPSAPPQDALTDADAPDMLYQGGLLLAQAGQLDAAANALRVSAVVRNLQDVRSVSGVGRPIWMANGTRVPALSMLAAADTMREADTRTEMAIMSYKQAFRLDPALAPAWNNLGVLYAEIGNPDRGRFYLASSAQVNPTYARGQQNLAGLAYSRGFGDFFTAEAAQGGAIKSLGPRALDWGYDLRYDDTRGLPTAYGPPTDLLSRLPALVILVLLLLHTLIGHDRTVERVGTLAARGPLGRLGAKVDVRAKALSPNLVTPRSGGRALLLAVGIPSLVGMLALAWGTGGASLSVFLVFLPVALLASLLAFGANELAQRIVALRDRAITLHHVWPLGVLIGALSIPLGFVYGWQNVTRVQPLSGVTGDGAAQADGRKAAGRRTRSVEEYDLAYEAEVEAIADAGQSGATLPARELALRPAGPTLSIFLAGLAANLALGLIFGALYLLTGWPSMRMAMFASLLVLAFAGVSEPPADGWILYRRNAPLWLAMFVFAALAVTLIAVGLI